MPSDIEIAHQTTLQPVTDIARSVDLEPEDLELYGAYKAKVSFDTISRVTTKREPGKLILVTAMTPTPSGEGKTTISIGLLQALWKLGKRAVAALREPSLGPVFGLKGGATGGGYSQVLPMEDINLHFTGDLHAVTTAHNLLLAMLDNHLHQGNELDIDFRSVSMSRALDMCDRSLRNTVIGLGGRTQGVPRENRFEITAASEIMTVLTMSQSIKDMKERLAKVVVAETRSGRPITAADLKAVGAMAATLRDALKPNLVQTVEGCPAFVHTGPFGNISIGCNSIMATRLAMHLGDYAVTEAGFGSDLGAEKCRAAGFSPNAIVVAGTIRGLKYQGGAELRKLTQPDMSALEKGVPNLMKHVENMLSFGVPVVCAINRFATDTDEEVEFLRKALEPLGVPVTPADIWAQGGAGGIEMAEAVVEAVEKDGNFQLLYPDELSLEEKIERVATKIYGAAGVEFQSTAVKKLKDYEAKGYGKMPVCIAKTQKSLSDNDALKARPEGFTLTVRDLRAAVGAGYVVAYAGDIMTMPGLARVPAAEKIDLTEDGEITGLF